MFLIFDTETTGLPKDYNRPVTDSDNWPRLVQLAWQLHDSNGKLLSSQNFIVKPDGFTIPFNTAKIHGITTERALQDGHPLAEVLAAFETDRVRAKYAVGHNVEFDVNVIDHIHHPFHFLLDDFEMVFIFFSDESNSLTGILGATGSAYAVYEIFGRPGQFVINHMGQKGNVYSS